MHKRSKKSRIILPNNNPINVNAKEMKMLWWKFYGDSRKVNMENCRSTADFYF